MLQITLTKRFIVESRIACLLKSINIFHSIHIHYYYLKKQNQTLNYIYAVIIIEKSKTFLHKYILG